MTNNKLIQKYINFFIIFATTSFIFTSCMSSKKTQYENENDTDTLSVYHKFSNVENAISRLFKTAFEEQNNNMYSPKVDSTVLYWLNNKVIFIQGSTKCNIFALNTLYKAGFKTPKNNALSKDLFNKNLFEDILPVINARSPDDIEKGDLIIWKTHVIIFESAEYISNKIYAKAIWAGTTKSDNGENIKNNVIYGRYPLTGNFIVRRPIER